MDLGISGLSSGFDWKSFIAQMAGAQRASQNPLRAQQSALQQKNSAYGAIKDKLTALQTAVKTLAEASRYETRAASVSDAAAATATAAVGAAPGTYEFAITRLATAARAAGTADIGAPLMTAAEVAAKPISEAGWPMAVSAGTFTINNRQVTLEADHTLQDIFDAVATATQNTVTAHYDDVEDKIVLSSASPIVLGSATDTSNFLLAARLGNNGTGEVASKTALGGARLGSPLASANLRAAVNDGGAGAGEFKINGVAFTFNAASDSLSSILERINSSAAGVTASYDTLNDRFLLTSRATGDMGVALEDVTGNFLAATGLTGGTLERGQDLAYTVNGGPELTSRSNTITDTTSGVTGLSVTALRAGTTFNVSVTNDTSAVKTAVQAFIDSYNQVVAYIGTTTASTTTEVGKVTSGILASETNANSIAASLRSSVFGVLSGLPASMNELADLGFQTNGYDKKIVLKDPEKLDKALAEDLGGIKKLFTDATNGMAARLDTLLTRTLGDEGDLHNRQTSLTKQSSEIDAQIARMEKTVASEQERMTRAFIDMEVAQARINQQLQYLTKTFS